MKRTIALLMALLLLACVPAGADKVSAGQAAYEAAQLLPEEERVVNVFTWTYYIPDEVVADFEAATGIRVNYAAMLGNEDVLPKLSTGGGQYDVVVCSDYILSDLIGMGLLAQLDYGQLPNAANIDPSYQSQYYDPDNAYTIPYTNTVPVIVYDPQAVDFEVTGFADLWREEFRDNLALVAEWRNVIGMAQKKLGYSYNDTDPEHMAQVGEELLALKPNIAVMNDDTPHNALIYGDAIAGFMYGSQVMAAREVMPQLEVVYPAEGLGFGIDCLVMPQDAPHAQAAYIFLNYLLDGEVSAYTSQLINYGNCNTAAVDFMSPEYLANDTVRVPAELVAGAEMMKPLSGEAQELYNQIWTQFMQ